MSVYTRVSAADLKALLADYDVGELDDFSGISSGITNTNYFVDTTLGRWVLTLFEQADADTLPFFMQLMDHLAASGTPCAHPVARIDGGFLSFVAGRTAALVYRLPGVSLNRPTAEHCAALGGMVAEMHHAVRGFGQVQPNARGLDWIGQAAVRLAPVLDRSTRYLLEDEIDYQRVAVEQQYVCLPEAVVHADLFRDNVLFEQHRVSGIIDFYYACHDYLLFDLAVICNDWAFDDRGRFDAGCWQAFMIAYRRSRPPADGEAAAWGAMLRAAALRFWASRLIDHHFPLDGEVTHVKDPSPFETLLRRHRQASPALMDP